MCIYYNSFAGRYTYSTTTTVLNPPMYVDFDCGQDDYSLSDCNIPSGLTTSISSCASADVIGIQCASKHDASLKMNFQCNNFNI